MTYQELIIKLIEIQKHMMPDLEKFEREGRLPHDLKVAKAEIIEWEHTVAVSYTHLTLPTNSRV